jgi:hypothetical protein
LGKGGLPVILPPGLVGARHPRLLLSAASTALNAWIGFASYRWKFSRYRHALYALESISDDLAYRRSCGVVDPRVLGEVYARMKHVVHDANTEWFGKEADETGRTTSQRR